MTINICFYGKKQVGKTRAISAILDIPYKNKPTIDIHSHIFNTQLTLLDAPLDLSKLHFYSIEKVYLVLNGNFPLDHMDLEAIHTIRRKQLPFEFLLCFNKQYADVILSDLPSNAIVHNLTSKLEIKQFRKKLHVIYKEKLFHADDAHDQESTQTNHAIISTEDNISCIESSTLDHNASPVVIENHLNDAYEANAIINPGIEPVDNPHSEIIPEKITWIMIGKENAGKSTLFNTLLGYERNVVSAIPGTTQASVYEQFEDSLLKDTAGIKKFNNNHIFKLLEKNSAILFLIDANIGMTAQDKKLLSRIEESGLGCLICINKIDLKPQFDTKELQRLFKHIACIKISAKNHINIEALLNEMHALELRLKHKFPTRILNNWILEKKHTFHLVKIKYMRHNSLFPYSFTCFTTPAILPSSQIQYIRNLLYANFPLENICFQLHIKAARSAMRAKNKPMRFKEKGYYKKALK